MPIQQTLQISFSKKAVIHKEAESEGIGSILAVPITVQDETIVIFRLLTAEIRHFSSADIDFAMAVAEQGGVAIQRAIDYKKITSAE